MKQIVCSIFLLIGIAVLPCFGKKGEKPQVIVYGADVLAFAAAVQSAQSDVPTLWLVPGDQLIPELSNGYVTVEGFPHVDGGVWMDILMEMALAKSPNDSLASVIKREMNPRLFQNAVDKIVRKLPKLTVLKGEKIASIDRRKRDWEVQLSSRYKYAVRCVVDASIKQELSHLIDVSWKKDVGPIPRLASLTLAQVRTLVATGQIGSALYGIELERILAAENVGFFLLRGMEELNGPGSELIPFRAAVGQALGATAAYLAFFKTTGDKVDIRKLQTELMTYRARILLYQDVAIEDRHFYALQRFGLAAVLPDLHQRANFYFRKEERVRYDEVKPIFDRFYSRSQLWFLDNKGDYFKWKDFLSLIKFVGLRGEEVNEAIEKEWSGKLGFDGVFDGNAFVTRYQFATVLDRFANPYIKAVNQEGGFVN